MTNLDSYARVTITIRDRYTSVRSLLLGSENSFKTQYQFYF